jgi:hypothetical protein
VIDALRLIGAWTARDVPSRSAKSAGGRTASRNPTALARAADNPQRGASSAGRRPLADHKHAAALPGGILVAEVFHKRLRPRVNAFRYKVSYLCLPLADIDRIDGRWLGVDRAAPVSFMRRDHGDGGDLAQWIRGHLRHWGLDDVCDGETTLIAMPRLFGYVFNPISFWCCHDAVGGLRAVLCEVRNTFGERHNYLVFHDDRRVIAPGDWLAARKLFHVSPFMPVEGHYRFRFLIDACRVAVTIDYHDKDGPILLTGVAGRRAPLDPRSAAGPFLRNPLMTLAVIFRIHWQAARLWFRRTPFFVKPAPPEDETTR